MATCMLARKFAEHRGKEASAGKEGELVEKEREEQVAQDEREADELVQETLAGSEEVPRDQSYRTNCSRTTRQLTLHPPHNLARYTQTAECQ